MAKRTAASIQADIAKGAFRPHTALSNMALAYYQSDEKSFAKTIFRFAQCLYPLIIITYLIKRIYYVTTGIENQHTAKSIQQYFPNIWILMLV